MSVSLSDLQTAIVAALGADTELVTAMGADAVFDAVPKGTKAPYIVVARHDLHDRDADAAPGHDHRLRLDAWFPAPDRAALAPIVARIVTVLTAADLSHGDTTVTHRRHVRTETRIEAKSGHAQAAIFFQFLSEPQG